MEHKNFLAPQNPNQIIWRYQDFSKMSLLLTSGKLYFRRADLLDDDFEGAIPKVSSLLMKKRLEELKRTIPKINIEDVEVGEKQLRKNIFLNCWHQDDCESVAMWKLYTNVYEGIVIQSSFERLKNSIKTSKNIEAFIGVVQYTNYENEALEINPFDYLHRYTFKRKSFSFENELRILMFQTNTTSEGIQIDIDLNLLIEKIVVSPYASKGFKEKVQTIAVENGYAFTVLDSELNARPIYF